MNDLTNTTVEKSNRKRWVWYGVLLTTLLVLIAMILSFYKNYRMIQHLEGLGHHVNSKGEKHCETSELKRGAGFDLIPASVEGWLRSNYGDDWTLAFAVVYRLDLRSVTYTSGILIIPDKLHRNKLVTDAELIHLEGLTKLEWLSLEATAITDAGLVHLEGLSNLKHLDLSQTNTSRAAVAKLQSALPHCEIVWNKMGTFLE